VHIFECDITLIIMN